MGGGRVNKAQEPMSFHENHTLTEPLLEELGLQRKQLSGGVRHVEKMQLLLETVPELERKGRKYPGFFAPYSSL